MMWIWARRRCTFKGMKTMKKLAIIPLVALAAALTACSNEDTAGELSAPKEINLASTLRPLASRATINDVTNDDYIASADTVTVWADMNNTARKEISTYFKAWKVRSQQETVEGQTVNKLKPWVSSDTKMFPSQNPLNFYAIHGKFERTALPANTAEFPIQGVKVLIDKNQSTLTNYKESDLLYAQLKGVWPIDVAVLPFYHMLSRITLYMQPGVNLTAADLEKATVTISNRIPSCTFTPAKTTTSGADLVLTSQTVRAAMLSNATAVSGSTENITINAKASTNYDADDAKPSAAVIFPQSFGKGETLITIKLQNGDTFYYNLDNDLTLESGKNYIFKVLINDGRQVNTIKATIEDWNDESEDITFDKL